ncbi:hypothetical protein HHK36_030390 [Tetracentron sinense]|uniref:Uncharacterized protein n=1 Tax=Tetracentron sinense TaxID=13715 RepID=A0A834Y784_TETSI|nr:hypothetical protein HHK36_030390 [Tetracentron sinense]
MLHVGWFQLLKGVITVICLQRRKKRAEGWFLSIKTSYWEWVAWEKEGSGLHNKFPSVSTYREPRVETELDMEGRRSFGTFLVQRAAEQGNCSRFMGELPHSSEKTPKIIDLLPGAPYDMQTIVLIYNFQQYRHVESLGWKLGWEWRGNEAIWKMIGAEATEQGNCSWFRGLELSHSYDTGVLWGNPFYNDILLQLGEEGNVQAELLLKKEGSRDVHIQGRVDLSKENIFRRFWGNPFYNNLLLQSGEEGNVQAELLLKKEGSRNVHIQGRVDLSKENIFRWFWGNPFYNDILLQSGEGNVQAELLLKKEGSRNVHIQGRVDLPKENISQQ